MTQTRNPRRFYIDHGENEPVVRTVPVHRPAKPQDTADSPATNQVAPVSPPREQARTLAARARRAPLRVKRIVQTARKHAHLPTA